MGEEPGQDRPGDLIWAVVGDLKLRTTGNGGPHNFGGTMPFTDHDLKRLKGSACSISKHEDRVGILPEAVYALLARLEAAEEVIEDFKLTSETEAPSIRAWRKAAGK